MRHEYVCSIAYTVLGKMNKNDKSLNFKILQGVVWFNGYPLDGQWITTFSVVGVCLV
jgi:methionine salvage enolase-phosphatase E1